MESQAIDCGPETCVTHDAKSRGRIAANVPRVKLSRADFENVRA
jgi:hypothetical protein